MVHSRVTELPSLDRTPVFLTPAYKNAEELKRSVVAMKTIIFREKKCMSVKSSHDKMMNRAPASDIPELMDSTV